MSVENNPLIEEAEAIIRSYTGIHSADHHFLSMSPEDRTIFRSIIRDRNSRTLHRLNEMESAIMRFAEGKTDTIDLTFGTRHRPRPYVIAFGGELSDHQDLLQGTFQTEKKYSERLDQMELLAE